MNMTVGLRTKVVSLQNGIVYRGIEGRRPARWAISPSKESIAKNIDEEVEDFDNGHVLGFGNIRLTNMQ